MKIIVKNLAVEYLDEGTGPVILMLPGWQDNVHTFDLLIKRLALRRRVIRLNLPGFGASEPPHETWTLDNYVELVADFVVKLGFSVSVIVGHSFGGRIAIKGVASGRLRVDKVVLIASAGIAKHKTVRSQLFKAIAKVGKVLTLIPLLAFWRQQLRRILYRWTGSDYLDAGPLQKTFVNIISEDLKVSAKQIGRPTLLLWGDQDPETPLTDGQILHHLIRGSRLEVLHGAGHFVHQEEADKAAMLIEEFVNA